MLRKLLAATTLALFASSIFVVGGPASGGTGPSPDDKLLVVIANLDEAYDKADAQKIGDMQNFVDRVLNNGIMPDFKPDVLLLQEVRGISLRNIASILSNQTGDDYIVPVNRPEGREERPSFRLTDRKVLHFDTGIIINKATVGQVPGSPEGWVRTSYLYSHKASNRTNVGVKSHAYMMVRKKDADGDLVGPYIPLTSVHFARGVEVQADKRTYYINQWTSVVASNLHKKFEARKDDWLKVIGGDFNIQRCPNPQGACNNSAWYKKMKGTGTYYKYDDALFHCSATGACENFPFGYNWAGKYALGVDFIFNTGKAALDAGKDHDAPQPNNYSDHIFRWAVLDVTDLTT